MASSIFCLAVVTELCPHGNLEDFMAREGAPLSPAVKLDAMLQVAEGLRQLKLARVVWRDLKAKNLLVRAVARGRAGEVVRVSLAFTDWGTAVRLPEEGKRRMTLHGPGTAGYIAPDTRGPAYDHRADMWAFLVWAASMCLTVECVVDCQLEEAVAKLQLEKKVTATAGHEEKLGAVLRQFELDGKVEEGCEGMFELVRTSAPWVDAQMRWSPEEAREEMEAFRSDHGLVCEPEATTSSRGAECSSGAHHRVPTTGCPDPAGERRRAEEEGTTPPDDDDDSPLAPSPPLRARAPAPDPAEDEAEAEAEAAAERQKEEAEEEAAAERQKEESEAEAAAARKAEAKAAALKAAATLRARAEALKAEAAALEAAAEAAAAKGRTAPAPPRFLNLDAEEEEERARPEEEDPEDPEDPEDADPADAVDRAAAAAAGSADLISPGSGAHLSPRAIATTRAAALSASLVGRRVRKWFPLSRPRGRPPKNPLPSGAYFEGVVTRVFAAPSDRRRANPNDDPNEDAASNAFELACHVSYDDGDEEDLALEETRALVADAERARASAPATDDNGCADSDAETEPVACLPRKKNPLARSGSAAPAASHRSQRSAATRRGGDARGPPPRETCSPSRSVGTRRSARAGAAGSRPALGALSTNDVDARARARARAQTTTTLAGTRKASKKAGGAAGAAELERVTAPTHSNAASNGCLALCVYTPGENGSVTKPRGRPPPEFAKIAADELRVALGCSKCRWGRYGCATCREKNGVGDERSVAELLRRRGARDGGDGGEARFVHKGGSGSGGSHGGSGGGKKKRGLAHRAALANKRARKVVGDLWVSGDAGKKSADAGGSPSDLLLEGGGGGGGGDLIDLGDVETREDLAARLPPGVELGCSKCRHQWRGCSVCRRRAGVCMGMAQNWKNRGRSGDAGVLALPAPPAARVG